MTNEALLEALERSGLIADDVLVALRRQVSARPGQLDPAEIVRQLVAEEHLTKAQGDRLLGAAAKPASPAPPPPPDDEPDILLGDNPAPVKAAGKKPPPRPAGPMTEDDLEVLPDEPDLLPPLPKKPAARPSFSQIETREVPDDLGLAPLPDDPLSSPLRAPTPSAKPKAASKSPSSAAHPPKPPKKRRTWRNEVAPAKPELAHQVDDLLGAAKSIEAAGGLDNRRARRAAHPTSRKTWDSPLMLIGGGSLLGLLLLGTVLFFLVQRETGDQGLEQAEQDYRSGSFASAILKFDQYLEKFPNHGSVSIARVHRGLATLRQTTEGGGDWPKALTTAHTVLEQISPETEFPSAQKDLATVLPAIAQGLTTQAHEKPSAALVDQARDAVALVDKYVPVTLQPTEQMREIDASLALTDRRLDRDSALATALDGMEKAIAAGHAQEAYAARRTLLKTYPELADDAALGAKMLAASEAERAAVKYVDEAREPERDEIAALTLASVSLTATSGGAAPLDDPDSIMMLAGNMTFALDPRSGKPRWRRLVGPDTEFVPQIIKTDSGPAALLVDTEHGAVVLVDANSGKLRWRQKIEDGPPAAPVVVRGRVYVATRSGRVLIFEANTGQMRGYVQLPQPLRIAPAVEPREQLYYQVAEHSNLYAITTETGACREVYYLGHEAESVAVPPLVIGRYLILVVNSGARDSVLRVLLADDEGLKLQAVEQVALQGHVFSQPVASGRALVVATDRGAVYSYELGAPDSGRTLTKLAEKPPDDKAPVISYVASRGPELWLAGYGLTRYELQASRGMLSPKWVNDDQAVVLHAPRVVGSALVFASRSEKAPGATVRAVNGGDGKRYWETRVGVPLAAPPFLSADASKAVVMTTTGALYEVPAGGLASRKMIDAPTAALPDRVLLSPDQPLVQLADGRCIFPVAPVNPATGWRDVLICDQREGAEKLRRRSLPEPAANRPAALAGGLLVPGKIGQVFVFDPDTGRSVVEPFQPVVNIGGDLAWTEPTVLDEKRALISDGATKLYLLTVVDAPRPHLEAAATVDLATPLATSLAVAGEFAYAVDTGNRLLSFHLPDLAPGRDWPLDSRPFQRPQSTGSHVLVGTLSGQLSCLNGAGALAWQVPLEAGCVIGSPLETGGAIVAGSTSGVVYRLALDTGKLLAQSNMGQPLALGPVRWHERLLFAGSDGTLHIVAEPK